MIQDQKKNLDHYLRQDRISESNNGRTLMTRIRKDKKKTYNRQNEKRNQNDSSFLLFVYNELLVETMLLSFLLAS
jgi:hypothetical protein